MRNKRKKKIAYGTRRFLPILMALVLLLAGMPVHRIVAKAGSLEDAYGYYQSYGNSVRFHAVNKRSGNIYYATSAKRSSSSIRFRTLGWKVSIKSMSGSTLQTIYYELDGDYMTCVDTVVKSGYEYNLYILPLESLRDRLNSKANKALDEGQAEIVLNACMAVVKNGKVKGKMNDQGSVSGKVYSSYSGIAGAENWSSAAKQSLHSYFDKEIKGLFYDVRAQKGTGIKSVHGGGHYMYGTHVTMSAKVSKGYTFVQWKGLHESGSIECSFYVNDNGPMRAEARPMELRIVYHRNHSLSDQTTGQQLVQYGNKSNRLQKQDWTQEGKVLLGYALSQGATVPNYSLTAKITDAWIVKYTPEIHLYAVWGEEDADGELEPPDTDRDSEPIYDWEETEMPEVEPEVEPEEETLTPELPKRPGVIIPVSELLRPSEPEPEVSEQTLQPIKTRFISDSYFEDENGNLIPASQGGLADGSRWRNEEIFRSFLRAVLRG